MHFGGSNNLFISCFLPFLLFPHPLLLHSRDRGDVGLRAPWVALEPHYPMRGATDHTGDPGSFSKVPQCGDWVPMMSFIHTPHTAAESTLNHLCVWKAVEGSSLLSQCGRSWTPSLWHVGALGPLCPPDCFLGWQTLMHSCICPTILIESEIGLSTCSVLCSVRRASGGW